MPFFANRSLDAALNDIVSNGDVFHLCSAEPASFAGIAAVELGSKSDPTYGTIDSGGPFQRRVLVSGLGGSNIAVTGEATHYAISDGEGELFVAGPLDASQQVTAGNPFDPSDFYIGFLTTQTI